MEWDLAAQPDAASADNGTCAESSRDEVGRCGCRSKRPRPGAGPGASEAAGAPFDAPRRPAKNRPAVHRAITIRATPGCHRLISAGVRRAPRRYRAGFGQSLSGDPFFNAGRTTGTSSSRGMRRGAPAAACTASQSGWRSRSTAPSAAEGRSSATSITPTAHDAAAHAGRPGLRAVELPQAPPRPRGRQSAELGAQFSGWHHTRWPRTSRRPRPSRRPSIARASDGGARAGRCGWKRSNRLPRPRPHPT